MFAAVNKKVGLLQSSIRDIESLMSHVLSVTIKMDMKHEH